MSLEIRYLKLFFFTALVALSALYFSSIISYALKERQVAIEYAKIEANASFNKDLLFRRWASMHGGVYAPVSSYTTPNPYLEFLPERDITTDSGVQLTLINPAYMTRQVHEISQEQYGVKGHITSLDPIRPENVPQEWEKNALLQFEEGLEEYHSIDMLDGEPYLTYMSPMYMEQSCMKCHGPQGYKIGDLRGGISVAVPLSKYYTISIAEIKRLTIGSILVYLFILMFSIFAYRTLKGELVKSKKMRLKLAESESDLIVQNEEIAALNRDYEIQNEELQIAKNKAEESEKLKDAFLHNLSHEIRTPMNAIHGFSRMLEHEEISDTERLEYAEIIKSSSNQLLNIVNDVLVVSAIETEQVEITKGEVDVHTMMTEVYEKFASMAEHRGLELTFCNMHEEAMTFIQTDREKLFRILTSLLSNSIKFTRKGKIEFGYTEHDDHLEFVVRDTGVGISQDLQDSIFNCFQQGDIRRSRAFTGIGLGLTISKGYVELLGGKIQVESIISEGSEFRFTIPVHSFAVEAGNGRMISKEKK